MMRVSEAVQAMMKVCLAEAEDAVRFIHECSRCYMVIFVIVALLLLYDVTNLSTFENIRVSWHC
jgi:hypothetical protein